MNKHIILLPAIRFSQLKAIARKSSFRLLSDDWEVFETGIFLQRSMVDLSKDEMKRWTSSRLIELVKPAQFLVKFMEKNDLTKLIVYDI